MLARIGGAVGRDETSSFKRKEYLRFQTIGYGRSPNACHPLTLSSHQAIPSTRYTNQEVGYTIWLSHADLQMRVNSSAILDVIGADLTEGAPLLNHDNEDRSLLSTLVHPPRRLTNLEKLLAGFSIVLLILMSTFIGLFASAEKNYKNEKGRHDSGGHGHGVSTTTEYATRTTTVSSEPTGKPQHVSCVD